MDTNKKLKIEDIRSSNRYVRRTCIQGDPIEVLVEVKKMMDNDHVTPMYEHMKLRLENIDLDEFPKSIKVILFKSLYAGD